jgi:hypothetical protein
MERFQIWNTWCVSIQLEELTDQIFFHFGPFLTSSIFIIMFSVGSSSSRSDCMDRYRHHRVCYLSRRHCPSNCYGHGCGINIFQRTCVGEHLWCLAAPRTIKHERLCRRSHHFVGMCHWCPIGSTSCRRRIARSRRRLAMNSLLNEM